MGPIQHIVLIKKFASVVLGFYFFLQSPSTTTIGVERALPGECGKNTSCQSTPAGLLAGLDVTEKDALNESGPETIDPTPTVTPRPTPLPPSTTASPTTIAPEPSPPLPTMNATPIPQITAEPTNVPIVTSSLMTEVNSYRKSFGLNELAVHTAICTIVDERIKEIKDSFNHDGFRQRLDNGTFSTLSYQGVAENIWYGSGSVTKVVEDWNSSSGHQENLKGNWSAGCGKLDGGFAVYIFFR